jgi:hypothetical protein
MPSSVLIGGICFSVNTINADETNPSSQNEAASCAQYPVTQDDSIHGLTEQEYLEGQNGKRHTLFR